MSRRVITNRHAPESKVAQVCEELRAMAYRHGPGYRLPTSREMCLLFGTSQVTLNDALNALEAQRILYRKARSGIFVSPQLHHRHILVLLDAAFFTTAGLSPFWGHLWGKFAEEAQRRAEGGTTDFSFTLVPSRPGVPLPESVVREVTQGRAHAALGVGIATEAAVWLSERIPLVQFAGPADYFVRLDWSATIREGVRLLAQRGCRHIALLRHWETGRAEAEPMPDWPEMLTLFHALIQSAGLNPAQSQAYGDHDKAIAGANHQEQGFALAQRLFPPSRQDAPDGLLIMDDMVTLGVLAHLRQRGLRPGKDVSIVTHANVGSSVLFGYERELDRIEVDPQDIVRAMFCLLDDLLAGKAPAEIVVTVPPQTRIAEREV